MEKGGRWTIAYVCQRERARERERLNHCDSEGPSSFLISLNAPVDVKQNRNGGVFPLAVQRRWNTPIHSEDTEPLSTVWSSLVVRQISAAAFHKHQEMPGWHANLPGLYRGEQAVGSEVFVPSVFRCGFS